MKNLFKVLGILFFYSFSCTKIIYSQGLEIGYYIQPQLSSINGSDHDSYTSINKNQTGTIYTGISVSYFLSKNFGVGTGLAYGHDSQKFVYERKAYGSPAVVSDNHYIFSFIKFPVLVKFHGKVNKIRFIIEGGPLAGYLSRVINKSSYGRQNYSDDYSKLQFGFQAGTGFGYQMSEAFTAFLKLNLEITDLNFHYTNENLDNFYPLGRSLAAVAGGLQLGVIWNGKTNK